jgi:hypothetical protein
MQTEGSIEPERLPNSEQAEVPESKIRDYLLSDTHPAGQSKARFFASLGYRAGSHVALAEAFRQIARSGTLERTLRSRFGSKYVVDGYIVGPAGSASVRTVWITEADAAHPRFVTAYPAPIRPER